MPTFYDRFRECAGRWPENTALEIQRRDGMEGYSYAQARSGAESLGRWLVENGFEPGTRCAILAENHPTWVIAYLGIIAAGCVVVPLDTAFHGDQVEKLLKDSGSQLVLCDAKHRKPAQNAAGSVGARLVLLAGDAGETSVPDLDAIFAAGPGQFIPVDRAPEDLAALLYTSGTTADPKGVMLTHSNLMGEVEAVLGWVQIGPDDAVLGVLPLFHVLSQMANLLLPLVSGCRVVYLETLNTTELLRALRERRISVFAVVPQFFYLIHERITKEVASRGALSQAAFSALKRINRSFRPVGINAGRLLFRRVHQTLGDRMRYLVTGGSRFDPQIGRDFYAMGIDVLQAYGLTETTGGAFATRPGNNVIGSVGPPLPGVEARILAPQVQEQGGPPIGEIAIRGPIITRGYWNRPEATAEVLKDGWFYTGDLGHFDAEGNLFITGRKKEVIILSNGKNVYPEEIEAHYLKSRYIKEICVLGLEARAGDLSSERLFGVVVPDFQVLKERKVVNAREVIRFDIEGLSAQLASTKRIGSYEIWQEDLPRTTTRKLKRFEIEKRARQNRDRGASPSSSLAAEANLSPEDQKWLEEPEVKRALTIIRAAARSSSRQVLPGDNLELDLGLDSMQRIELLVALEQELGGDVEESRLADIYTVRDLVNAIRESAARGDAPPPQAAAWGTLLREEPSDPEVLGLVRPRPFSEASWFGFSRLLRLFSEDRFQLRVEGLEKLPTGGAYIISSNHQSYIDPAVLGSLLPWVVFRKTFSVGTSEIFGKGFMRGLARQLRVVVLDPDANLVPAMRAGAFGLRHGLVLILYPEGERSIDGSPKIFKKGAAILSIHLQVPIVPVAIDGFHDAWPRGKPFQRFAPLKMKFGDPIYPPPESSANERSYEEFTAKLKSVIFGMWMRLSDPPTTAAEAQKSTHFARG